MMGDIFDALAHPVRRGILKMLRHGPRTAGDIAAAFDIAKPTLSGHFAVLKAADLVTAERRGTSILYRVNTSVLEDALAVMMDIVGTGGGTVIDKEVP